MRLLVLTLAASLLGFAPAPLPRPSRDGWNADRYERHYTEVDGRWRPVELPSPLVYLSLTHNGSVLDADDGASAWRLHLCFAGRSVETFAGRAECVRGDRGGLRIHLPPAETKRGTRLLLIRKDGDRLRLLVIGGRFEGAYLMKR